MAKYDRVVKQLVSRIAALENTLTIKPSTYPVVAVDRVAGTVDLLMETGPEDDDVLVPGVPYSASYYPEIGEVALVHRIGDTMIAMDNTHTGTRFDEATKGRADLTVGPELIVDPNFEDPAFANWEPGESTVAQWMFDLEAEVTAWQNIGVDAGTTVPTHQPPVLDTNFSQNGGSMVFVPPESGEIRLLSPHFSAPVLSGDLRYRASMSTRANVFSGRRAYINLRWYTDSGGTVPHTTTPFSSGEMKLSTSLDWTRLSVDAAAPTGTVKARLEVVVEQVDAEETYRFDTAFILGAPTSVVSRLSTSSNTVVDTFTRANSTTTLGAPWTARRGTWGVASNRGYLSATTGNRNIATMNGTQNGSIEFTLPTAAQNGQGLIWRYQDDSNYWFISWISGFNTWVIWKRVAGVDISVGACSSGAPNAAGTHMLIHFPGNNQAVYLNGRISFFWIDAAHNDDFKHGLYYDTPASLSARWDDWRMTDDVETYLYQDSPTLEIKSTAAGMATARTPVGLEDYLPCSGGDEYLISVRTKNRRTNSGIRLASIGTAFFTDDGSMIETKISSPTLATWEWSRVISTVEAPPAATQMRVYVGFLANGANEYVYFDDASCRRSTSITSAALRMGQPGQPRIEVLPNNNLNMSFYPTDDPNDVAGSIEATQNKMKISAPRNSVEPNPVLQFSADRIDLVNPTTGAANWITHTPAVSWSLGSQTPHGRYWMFNQTCFYQFYMQMGSGSAASGHLYINLPFAANSAGDTRPCGSLIMYDNTTGRFHTGLVSMIQGNSRLYFFCNNGLVAGDGTVTSTAPFTWAATSDMWGSIVYEIAP